MVVCSSIALFILYKFFLYYFPGEATVEEVFLFKFYKSLKAFSKDGQLFSCSWKIPSIIITLPECFTFIPTDSPIPETMCVEYVCVSSIRMFLYKKGKEKEPGSLI